MEEWTTAFKTAVAAALLVLIISIVMSYVYLGYRNSEQSQNVVSSQISNFDYSLFQSYDNCTVNGVNILTAVEQFRGQDIGIIISLPSIVPKTMSGPEIQPDITWEKSDYYHYYIKTGGALNYVQQDYKLYDVTDDYYINPTAKYHAILCKTKADVVIGICFSYIQ